MPGKTGASNASNANNAAPVSHTRACDNNVEIEIEEQVDPFTHLPFFPEGHEWPRMLRQIMAFGQSREQRDVLLLGGLTTLGASLAQTLRFLYGGKWFFSSLQTFVVAPPPEKACSRGRECSCNRSTTRSGRPWRRR